MGMLERGEAAVAATALSAHAAPRSRRGRSVRGEPRRASSGSASRSRDSAATRCSCTPCRCRIRASTPSDACARRWPRSTGDREASSHARHERLAATVACKAAIKAGDELSPGEMRALFVALGDTTLPAHDVHGRVDDRAALVGRARAALWPTAERGARPRHLRPDGGGEDAASRCGSRARDRSSIVSADSRQVYRGFDIGTAKPTAAEQRAVPHRGIDVLDPDRARTRRHAWADARRRVDPRDARASGATPLVVGGTGLYLRALFGGLFEEPALDPVRRAALAARARGASTSRSCGAGCARSIRRARTSGARSCCARSRSRCSPGGA